MWLPDAERQLVRQIAPGFQQTSGLKLDAERMREKGIVRLNLRYTKVTNEDVRYGPPFRCSGASEMIQVSFQMDLLLKTWAVQACPYPLTTNQSVPRIAQLTHDDQVHNDPFWNTNTRTVWFLFHCHPWGKVKVFTSFSSSLVAALCFCESAPELLWQNFWLVHRLNLLLEISFLQRIHLICYFFCHLFRLVSSLI